MRKKGVDEEEEFYRGMVNISNVAEERGKHTVFYGVPEKNAIFS